MQASIKIIEADLQGDSKIEAIKLFEKYDRLRKKEIGFTFYNLKSAQKQVQINHYLCRLHKVL